MSSPASRRNAARPTAHRAFLTRLAEDEVRREERGCSGNVAQCGCHHLISITRNGSVIWLCVEHGELSGAGA